MTRIVVYILWCLGEAMASFAVRLAKVAVGIAELGKYPARAACRLSHKEIPPVLMPAEGDWIITGVKGDRH